MALTVAQVGTKFTASAAASVTSAAITTTAGSLLVCTCSNWNGNHNTLSPSLVFSDNKSSTWATDAQIQGDGSGTASYYNGQTGIGSAQNTTGGASHTVSVTDGLASGYYEGNFIEVSGAATSSALDKIATEAKAAGSTSANPTTATTTQANEIVFGVVQVDSAVANVGVSDPPTTSYTSIGVNQSGLATIGYDAGYLIVSSTGTQTAGWTFSGTSQGSSAAVATYKASAGDTLMGQACL